MADHLIDRASAQEAIRAHVLQVASEQIGTTDPFRYFADAAPCYQPKDYGSKSWCQIFCLYVYRACGLTELVWRDQLGFVGELDTIDREQALPGDMTILENTKYGVPVWHGNLFRFAKDWRDYTIDGNTSTGVDERDRDIRVYTPRPIYKSIQSWVDAMVDNLDDIKGLIKETA